MFRAISDGDSEELSRFMGENLNVLSTDRGWTPLYLATYYQDQTMCDMLIKNGADINFPNEDKSTPLFAAIQNPELFVSFLKEGSKLDVINAYGQTVIHIAVINQQNDTLEIIIKGGLDIHIKDMYGNDAMYYAKQTNNLVAVDLLNSVKT